MGRLALLCALILGLAGAAMADPVRVGNSGPPPGGAEARPSVPSADRSGDGFCRSQGVGFRRIEGTNTCVRIGGSVQMDSYVTGAGSAGGSGIEPALRSR